jgi:hypothetical protein
MGKREKQIVKRSSMLPILLAACPLAAAPVAAPERAPAYVPEVSVVRFDASVAPDGKVWLDWRTGIELGTGVFRAEREAPDGTWALAGEGYLPMRGEEEDGDDDAYRLHDPAAHEGETARYRLTFMTPGGEEWEAAAWQGRLARMAEPPRKAAAGAAPDAAVPLASPPEPQDWIGNVSRVKPWSGAEPADRVRLSLRTTGIYRVTAAELAAASGWNETDVLQAIATTNLTLSCQGSPVAWLADGDALLFHGEPPTTCMAPENVYWVAPGTGTAMAAAAPEWPQQPATNAWFPESLSYQGTNHLTRVSYNSRTDLPFTTYGQRSSTSKDKNINTVEAVYDPAPGSWTGTVSVALLSYFENTSADDHAVAVSVGGVSVGSAAWSGEQLLTCAFPFPSSSLGGQSAAITVRHTAASPPLMTTDYTRFVWLSCELDYPRAYRARRDALLCRGGDGNLSAVTGFSTNDVVALDVTEPRSPVVVASTELSWEGAEAGWTAAFPSGGTGATYQVFSRSAGVRRPSVRGVRSFDAADFNGVAHVILVPPEGWCDGFREAAQPLAEFRTAEGLPSVVVDVETLYDEFSHGLVDTEAIQAFCSELKPRGLRYLLLAGAGAVDFRHERLTVGDYTACLIPTCLGGQRFPYSGEDMVAALDGELADVDDDNIPDLAIGRIPTSYPQQVATVVQKTLAFEQERRWREMAVLTADWDCTGVKYKEYPFSNGTERLVAPLSAHGRNVERFYTSDPDGSLADVRINHLFPALRTGATLFHFFGHANELRLGYRAGYDSLLRNTDIKSSNWQKPVIAVCMSCLPNRWHALSASSTPKVLLPYGLMAAGTGFVAGIGPTAYQLSDEGEELAVQFYSGINGEGVYRLGDLWLHGLRSRGSVVPRERLLCVSLVGDPAVRFDQISSPATIIILR